VAASVWQILVSQTVKDLVALDLPPEVSLRDLGLHSLTTSPDWRAKWFVAMMSKTAHEAGPDRDRRSSLQSR
jgi:hypothetical protein